MAPFVSHAQNFEDVLLWRALHAVPRGFYIDVGAWDPDLHSVTRTFYDAGWHGINIEPVPELLAAFARRRSRDINLAVAVGDRTATLPFHYIPETGLSTLDTTIAQIHEAAGHRSVQIDMTVVPLADICRAHAAAVVHFLKIDCEGSERAVLMGADFRAFRPWIVLVEATRPNSPEPNHAEWEDILLDAEYRFVWFDGLNRFYVAAEHHADLARHFVTPPNVFDNFVRIADPPAAAPVHSPRALAGRGTLSVAERVDLTASCRDADPIPKVADAGSVTVEADGTRVQVMHNGIKVVADGYYGPWMTGLIARCAGHHEPQEERAFHEVMRHLPADASMIELGGFWAYYTAWFLQHAPDRRAVVLEPDPAHLSVGERNLALNGLAATFVSGFATGMSVPAELFGTEQSGRLALRGFTVPELMLMNGIVHLDVLHCDVQGAELQVIEGCRSLCAEARIGWMFVSTHAHQISGDPLTHQRCLALLRELGATIVAEHDVYESFSGDGLIVARFGELPEGWAAIPLTRARYAHSLFPNPSFELADALGREAPPAFIEKTVGALYRSLLLREPDPVGLSGWTELISADGDVAVAIRSMLGSAEFLAGAPGFLRRYFGQADPAAISSGGKLDCTALLLKIERDCPLGLAGERLLVPRDQAIYPVVVASGGWNPAQVAFVAERLPRGRHVLLDIGANIGLFSRQLMRLHDGISACFCVEPDPDNFVALTFNLPDSPARPPVRLFNVGLGEADGSTMFYRDRDNCGNYSVHADAMRDRPFSEIKVTIAETGAWMRRTLPDAGRLVWKSDTQGNDEAIVAATPPEIWDRVDVAVLELWRIRKPTGTRDAFLDRIAAFPHISLGVGRMVTVQDVAAYLASEDWEHEDLYLWRAPT